VDCATVEVTCIARTIFTPPATIEPFTVQRPAVLHSAWRSPDGAAALFLFNYTRAEQPVTIARTDGLVPDGQPPALVLPPRSMHCVSLTASP